MNDNQNTVTRPYRGADIVKDKSNASYEMVPMPVGILDGGESYYEDNMTEDEYASSINKEAENADVSTVKFADKIKVDFIPSIDYRIMCRFLGLHSVNDVKNHPYSECPLITMMLMESLINFMKDDGYSFEGELNFDRQGNAIPPEKTVWKVDGKEVSFTSTGFMYFENTKENDKPSNLVFFLYTNLDHGLASITCYTKGDKTSETVVQKLEQYSKDNNCLRGLKLRDINMYSGAFTEVEPRPDCIWENYYYTDDVQGIFENEVFGFLNNVEEYNAHGMTKRGVIIFGKPGTGKCLAKGTTVLMYDGTIKPVEEIKIGEMLMGPDSVAREVLSTTNGDETMYEVVPNKGDSYTVNESHILSLKSSGGLSKYSKGQVINLSVKDYLSETDTFRHRVKGYKTGVTWREKDIPIDPYFLGIWLGDGHSNSVRITTADVEIVNFLDTVASEYKNMTLKKQAKCGKAYTYGLTTRQGGKPDRNEILKNLKFLNLLHNKHIPLCYKANSEKNRLLLLAGILDSDGYKDGAGFGITLKSEKLMDDVIYLCRSLGLAAYKKEILRTCTNSKKPIPKIYFRCHISGDLSGIPLKLEYKRPKKRIMNKNVLVTGIKVKNKGIGQYFGFEIDGDGLFMLGDFTVTHNTTLGHIICNNVPDKTVIWITPEIVQENQHRSYSSIKLLYKLAEFVSPSVIMLEDIDLFAGDRSGGGDLMGLGSLMNVLDGVNTVKNAVTVASTNRIETIEDALRNRPGRFDRVVEVPALSSELRKKMFADRLKEWPFDDKVLEHLVQKTNEWTGAEAQEFVNTLNLKSIREAKKIEILDIKLVDDILETMAKFGVGESSGKSFGFGNRSN